MNDSAMHCSGECTIQNEEMRADQLIRAYFDLENISITGNIIERSNFNESESILEVTSRLKGSSKKRVLFGKPSRSKTDGHMTTRKILYVIEKPLDWDTQYATLYYTEMERLIDLV